MDREKIISVKESEISERNAQIKRLEDEIARLNALNADGSQASAELQKLLKDTQ